MRAPFGLGNEEALRGLVGGAGFQDVRGGSQGWGGAVRVGARVGVAYGARSPLASPIGVPGRAGLVAEVQAALERWQGAAGLAFPIEALLVSVKGAQSRTWPVSCVFASVARYGDAPLP